MASSLRNAAPLSFVARGLSDATDATNVGRGAMRALTNMVPNPTMRGSFVCRPAAVDVVDMSILGDFYAVSAYVVLGNLVYGMASDNGTARDFPFIYDLDAGVFLTMHGAEAGNTPASFPAAGDWTPPIMAQVASRIIVTHTGFANLSDETIKFGWIDISSFSSKIAVDYFTNVAFLYGGPDLVFGVQPGMLVSGSADIPPNTRVKNVYPNTQSVWPFTADSHGTDIIDGISVGDHIEMYPGKSISGPGVQPGTVILEQAPSATSIRLSRPTTTSEVNGIFRVYGNLTNHYPYLNHGDFTLDSPTILNATTVDLHIGQSLSGPSVATGAFVAGISGTTVTMSVGATQTVTFGGDPVAASFAAAGSVIELDKVPTGTATNSTSIMITGGTPTSPLWGAGDTAINPLPSIPVGVEQMNGRAWFACLDDGIPYSDSLLPCVRTSATQALMSDDRREVTAIAPLMLSAPITGGIVQALIAFQGVSAMHQISGDPATENLRFDILPVLTGTLAPNAIAISTLGTFFVSPDGLRLIDRDGKISDPIGQDGDGVVAPFLRVTAPPYLTQAPASRMAAAAAGRTLRIEVPGEDGAYTSYWFDLARKIWTGPHPGARLVKVWQDTFLIAKRTTAASPGVVLQRADDTPKPYSVYHENGRDLDFEWETSLMPDNGSMAMNTFIESTLMIAISPGELVRVNFLDETRDNLDGITLRGLDVPEALWGRSVWGVTWAGPDTGVIRQRQIPWTRPLVFKQGRLNIRGQSSATIVLGNFYIHDLIAGYMISIPQIPTGNEAELRNWLLTDSGQYILDDQGRRILAG